MSIQYSRKTVVDFSNNGCYFNRSNNPPELTSGWDMYEVWITNYTREVEGLREPSENGRYQNETLKLCGRSAGIEFCLKTDKEGGLSIKTTPKSIIRVKDIDDITILESKPSKNARDDSTTLDLDHEMIVNPSNKILRDGSLVVQVWNDKGYPGKFRDPFIPKNGFNQNMLNLLEDSETADIAFKISGSCNYQYESDDTEINRLNVQALFGKLDEGFADDTVDTSVIIYAHMLVLKACSPLLASLCEGYSKSNPVPITNAEPGVFRYMIRYVYGGIIPPSQLIKRASIFIEMADRYNIKNLKMEAEAWYVKSDLITVENCIEVFTFAHRMNCPLLLEKAADFFLNKPNILKSSSFDFVDTYMHALQTGPHILIVLMDSFYLRYAKDIIPLYGKRIAKSYKMSYKLLTVSSTELCEDGQWLPLSISGSSLDSMRRKLHDEGLDFEGSRGVLTSRLDSKVPDWKKNTTE